MEVYDSYLANKQLYSVYTFFVKQYYRLGSLVYKNQGLKQVLFASV